MNESQALYSRRNAGRHAVDLECEVRAEGWHESVALRATDLSTCGIWIESQLPLEPGSRVELSLSPPGWSRPWSVSARVARVGLHRRRHDALASGMGLQFEGMADFHVAALARALDGLPPPLPRKPAHSRWLQLGGQEVPASVPRPETHDVSVEAVGPLLRG